MKRVRYFVEGIILRLMLGLFGLLPLDAASSFGGFIGRSIGPRLAASRKALHNLQRGLPGHTEAEYKKIISGMWDNLGRVMAEYPHLYKIGQERVEFVNAAIIDDLQTDDKPSLLFSAHMGNWEISAATLMALKNFRTDLIYRPLNNPVSDRLIMQARLKGGMTRPIPKSHIGARQMVRCLSEGGNIGMLVDQKYNGGVPVHFFGRLAMTSPAYVQLAQRFDCPLIPVRIERLGGAHFRVTFFDNLPHKDRPVTDVLEDAHRLIEGWVRERPEQWLWLHKRWDSKQLQELSNDIIDVPDVATKNEQN